MTIDAPLDATPMVMFGLGTALSIRLTRWDK
jgi:hypothetical protein